jgi:superfamily II DNA/RNA helicase
MLDKGFITDVEKIVSLLSPMRTTLLFSATMPKEIKALADKFLSNPKEITVSRPEQTAETITQALIMVDHKDSKRVGGGQKEKRDILRQLILQNDPRNAIIFCNRKRDVDIVCKSLVKHGFAADRLHGDMDQSSRMETLTKFKADGFKFMVCSDVAARGLDIPAMSHVFNFDVPTHPEDYVHRIGRTGRAGNKGNAYTIATKEDRKYLTSIEQITGHKIPEITLDRKTSSRKAKAFINIATPETTDAPPNKVTKKPRRRRSNQSTNIDNSVAEIIPFKKKKTQIKAHAETVVDMPTDIFTKRSKENSPLHESKKSSKSEELVKGLGAHMPAFLMSVPTPKKRTKSQIEADLKEEDGFDISIGSEEAGLESFDDTTKT